MPEFIYRKLVEFAETDAAGIVHFSNYFRYMEIAEHAFLRRVGLILDPQRSTLNLGWPRVRAECDYKIPLRFDDSVAIHISLAELREKSLTLRFVFMKEAEGQPPVEAARGILTIVCVKLDANGEFAGAAAIPDDIAATIRRELAS